METVVLVGISAAAIIGGCTIWMLVCNERTYRHRTAIINANVGRSDYWKFAREYDSVSYHDHIWRLVFFGDWRTLYGPLIQSEFARSTSQEQTGGQ